MKAQLVKTFIKAAAIVALATSIANCGAMPEESVTETTYQPSSQPAETTEPIVDGCEAFGLVYDDANNTCDIVTPDRSIIHCKDFHHVTL